MIDENVPDDASSSVMKTEEVHGMDDEEEDDDDEVDHRKISSRHDRVHSSSFCSRLKRMGSVSQNRQLTTNDGSEHGIDDICDIDDETISPMRFLVVVHLLM